MTTYGRWGRTSTLKLQSINCFLLGLPNWQVHVFWIKVETGVNIANLWPVMIIQEIDSSCFVHLKVQVEHSSSQDSRCGSCHSDDAKCCYSKNDESGCVMTLSMQLLPWTAIGIAINWFTMHWWQNMHDSQQAQTTAGAIAVIAMTHSAWQGSGGSHHGCEEAMMKLYWSQTF